MRRLRVLPLLAFVCLAAPVAAYAGTTVGSTPAPTDDSCTAPGQAFQVAAPDGSSAAVPGAGVLTSWSFRAGAQLASVELRVFRSTAAANTYTVVGSSGGVRDIAPNTGLRTFPTRLPVETGDYVGLRTDTVDHGACLAMGAGSGYLYRGSSSTPGPVGSTDTYGLLTGTAIDISAVWEPDADRDGYGDETQDLCPASAMTQAACPAPDTTIKGKVRPEDAKTMLKLSSTVAGSTFSCTLDKKPATRCGAKVTYKCLPSGKHKLSVIATSPFGIADPTPARLKFSLDKVRTGC